MKQYNAARTYQFRVQVTRDDHHRLADHCRLYNGAVQERRDAWRMARRSITFPSQCRELVDDRAAHVVHFTAAVYTYQATASKSTQAVAFRDWNKCTAICQRLINGMLKRSTSSVARRW